VPLLALMFYYAIQAYILLIFVWVLGSWFPQWKYDKWYQFVESLVSPYMNLFRALPLSVGMLDLTPMLAIIVLILFERLVMAAAAGGLH
jgi:YggT family protein